MSEPDNNNLQNLNPYISMYPIKNNNGSKKTNGDTLQYNNPYVSMYPTKNNNGSQTTKTNFQILQKNLYTLFLMVYHIVLVYHNKFLLVQYVL